MSKPLTLTGRYDDGPEHVLSFGTISHAYANDDYIYVIQLNGQTFIAKRRVNFYAGDRMLLSNEESFNRWRNGV